MQKKLACLLGLLINAGLLLAQFETAEVLGTVRDASGGNVPGASVTLTNQDTNIQMRATTDDNGNYDFFNVRSDATPSRSSTPASPRPPPPISRSTSTPGSASISRCRWARSRSRGGHRRGRGARNRFERTRAGDQHAADRRTAAQRPQLFRPGAARHQRPSVADRRPCRTTPREGAFNVNGMRSTYNNFLLDGVDNNAYSTSNQGFSNQVAQPSPDAIAEFKVITSNYSAEYGRVGGAVVNVAMRSGTNQIHGTALRVSAQHGPQRGRLIFKPTGGVEADAAAQSVRRHHRRADHQEQDLLLRRLRRLPQHPAGAQSSTRIPNLSDRAGVLPGAGGQSADRRGLSRRARRSR